MKDLTNFIMKHLFLLLIATLTWFSCTEEPKNDEAASATEQADGSVPLDKPGESSDGIFESVSVVDSISGQVYKKQKPLNPLSTAISASPITKVDPVKPSFTPPSPQTPQQSRVVRVLTSNYWVVKALVKMSDPAANGQNQGAWFKFKEDGSYDYGYFENKIGSGAWTFDGQKALILLDSELLGDDREWSIKIGNTEDVMVWVGTSRFATTDVQTKLENFLFIPKNKGEMGYEQ